MRIALITISFFPKVGGAEFVVHNLAIAWSRQGHDVCVFNPLSESDPGEELGYAVRKFRIPFSYFKLPPHLLPFRLYAGRSIKRLLDEFKPDFISAHMGYPLGVWLGKLEPRPEFLMTCHGRELTNFSWGYRQMYKIDKVLAQTLNESAGAIAISSQARQLMEEMGVKSERILDIPNGVDLQRFRKKVNFDFRGQMGIPEGAPVVLSVGREHPQKAYDDGIKAFARIARKRPDVFYVLLGRGTSKWKPLVEELRLQGQVMLHEGLSGDELVGAYQQADLFFSPSVWELMPLVVLEALACGLPMVVTNVSGSRDLIEPDQNGLLVAPRQLDAMAVALDVLIRDKSLRTKMRDANMKKSEDFSWDRISKRYIDRC